MEEIEVHKLGHLSELPVYPADAYDVLQYRFSDSRRTKMLETAASRTSHLKLVLQDVHLPHNVSACLRSAEAFGLRDVDVVLGNKKRYRPSTVARGVDKWLRLKRHPSIEETIAHLREQNYKIAVGIPRPQSYSLESLPIDQPLAIVFGNEHDGVDERWLDEIDYPFMIPMAGMVESLNISVSCAVSLYTLRRRLEVEVPESCYLSKAEQKLLLNEWACRQVPQYLKEIEHYRKSLD
jgi:tRNA (guanosine-2'-O-)-methyltransferase